MSLLYSLPLRDLHGQRFFLFLIAAAVARGARMFDDVAASVTDRAGADLLDSDMFFFLTTAVRDSPASFAGLAHLRRNAALGTGAAAGMAELQRGSNPANHSAVFFFFFFLALGIFFFLYSFSMYWWCNSGTSRHGNGDYFSRSKPVHIKYLRTPESMNFPCFLVSFCCANFQFIHFPFTWEGSFHSARSR